MQAIEIENTLNLSSLPHQAQVELYDFYLFLQQRYANKNVKIIPTKEKENALKNFLENNKTRHIKIAPDIDLIALADEVNDMEI
jgi:hypothetical protein